MIRAKAKLANFLIIIVYLFSLSVKIMLKLPKSVLVKTGEHYGVALFYLCICMGLTSFYRNLKYLPHSSQLRNAV